MPIDKTKLSKEMMRKALQCETADELLALVPMLIASLTACLIA